MRYTQKSRQSFEQNDVRWWSKTSIREPREMSAQEIRETEDVRRVQKLRSRGSGWHGKSLAEVSDLKGHMEDGFPSAKFRKKFDVQE